MLNEEHLATQAAAVLDTQQTELIGAALFEVALVRNGFEVAQPRRDRGVDLVVYTDADQQPFNALPVQLKIANERSFSLDRKYKRKLGLVLAYIWLLPGEDPYFFLMSFDEALDMLHKGSTLDSISWTKNGYYRLAPLDKQRTAKIQQYRNRWVWLRQQLSAQSASTPAPIFLPAG